MVDHKFTIAITIVLTIIQIAVIILVGNYPINFEKAVEKVCHAANCTINFVTFIATMTPMHMQCHQYDVKTSVGCALITAQEISIIYTYVYKSLSHSPFSL